jgi:hypothetical protein
MPANTSEAELKGIYAALSDDLRNAVRTAGGEKAAAAFERANAFKAKTASQVEALNKIVGASSDEALSSKLLAMAGSTGRTDIKNLMLARGVRQEKRRGMNWPRQHLRVWGRDAEGHVFP